jgi:hypothetical protein
MLSTVDIYCPYLSFIHQIDSELGRWYKQVKASLAGPVELRSKPGNLTLD